MAVVLGIFILCIFLFLIPMVVGNVFAGVDTQSRNPVFLWISGQFLVWAGFQLMCVPMILAQKEFPLLLICFSAYMAILLLIGMASIVRDCKRLKTSGVEESIGGHMSESLKAEAGGAFQGKQLALWCLFGALLVFQLIQAVVLAYADGDDAFYVAISGITENSELMYQSLPYTGGTSELDVRHGMAPFPIWIAYLSRVSGIKAVSVAHIAMPLMLIPMTYGIFYLVGRKLFGSKDGKLPLFLIMTELLVLFGDYSFKTAENFMIARSRQGKAALGSIVIPMLFWALYLLLEKLQAEQKIGFRYWLLLWSVVMTGCLCSTMGALLICMLLGVVGLCAMCCYRKWKFLFPGAVCCLPCVIYAALYLMLG